MESNLVRAKQRKQYKYKFVDYAIVQNAQANTIGRVLGGVFMCLSRFPYQIGIRLAELSSYKLMTR